MAALSVRRFALAAVPVVLLAQCAPQCAPSPAPAATTTTTTTAVATNLTVTYDGAGPGVARIGLIGDSTLAAIRWTGSYAPLRRWNYTLRRRVVPAHDHAVLPGSGRLRAGQRHRGHAPPHREPGHGARDDDRRQRPGQPVRRGRRRRRRRSARAGRRCRDLVDRAGRRRQERRAGAAGPAARGLPHRRRLGGVQRAASGVEERRRAAHQQRPGRRCSRSSSPTRSRPCSRSPDAPWRDRGQGRTRTSASGGSWAHQWW